MTDAINPSHYRSHPSGIECIEISKHLSGCLAQAFQYVWRCGQKDDPVQELKKAIWFIDAELATKPYVFSNPIKIEIITSVFHGMEDDRHEVLWLIMIANLKISKKTRKNELERAKIIINKMIDEL